MVAKVNAMGAGFGGVARYCLHDEAVPEEGRPQTSERVGWAEVRNLAGRPERAAAQMAATWKAAPELKRLAGVSTAGRKLEKPVYHYSLSWEKDERPGREDMRRAADETLKALGLERHQALIVAHTDKAHPHVHVVVNRVDPETGKAASRGNDRLKLSRWAERWEREHGREGCPERVENNKRREAKEYVVDKKSLPTGRWRRERMNPPAFQEIGRNGGARIDPEKVRPLHPPVGGPHAEAARERWREREGDGWTAYQAERREALGDWSNINRHDWRKHYADEREQRAAVEALAGGGIGDRIRLARITEQGAWDKLDRPEEEKRRGLGRRLRSAVREARASGIRDAVGALRGDPAELQRRALKQLEQEHRTERARIGRVHHRRGEGAEEQAGEVYRDALAEARREAVSIVQGAERQAAARSRPPPTPERTPERGPDRGVSFDR